MEKGGDTDSSSNLDKKTSSNSDFHPSHTTATQPKFLIMASPLTVHHQQHHPFLPHHGGGTAGEAALGLMYSPSDGGGAHDFGRTSTILQPFENFHPSGAGMATVFPFTAVQWKELERQAMIYKCMISSVPVPPHLLFPIDSSVPTYSRKGDAEPGRCKRTDGKKWRCSREVAPQQKYCERHLHRGRPRSRKPVEPKTNSENHKKTRLDQTKTQNDFKPKTDVTTPTPYYKGANSSRDSGLMSSMGANIGLSGYSSCSFDQDYAAVQQPLNLFCYPNFSAPEMEVPTGFIDAWSIDNRNKGSGESSISVSEGDVSPSLNLSMAMAVGSALDEQMRSIQTDWEPFARGGPLAEALQPVGGSNPASPYNSVSTPATTVSSPSGVLHWTLFSHSDGSVCNSPTLAAEMSNQWHI